MGKYQANLALKGIFSIIKKKKKKDTFIFGP